MQKRGQEEIEHSRKHSDKQDIHGKHSGNARNFSTHKPFRRRLHRGRDDDGSENDEEEVGKKIERVEKNEDENRLHDGAHADIYDDISFWLFHYVNCNTKARYYKEEESEKLLHHLHIGLLDFRVGHIDNSRNIIDGLREVGAGEIVGRR